MAARNAAWLSAVLCAVACGGPAQPAAGPETEAPAESAEPQSEAGPADAPASGDAASEKSDSNAPSSEADVTAILQLVVDDPELDNYLHLGTAGRFPLQISGDKLPSGLKLIKATEPVKVVDAPKSKKDAVLVITEIDVQGDKASVRYRYDIEGIRGNVTLAKGAHGWELKNSRLVEH
jgi:hypothetical protein